MSESSKSKQFPIWALLILYLRSDKSTTYCNHFEGLTLLRDWLSQDAPIELTPHSEPIPYLYRNYEMQELARILGTTQDNLNHAYITASNIEKMLSLDGVQIGIIPYKDTDTL